MGGRRPAVVVPLCFLVAAVDGYDAQSVAYVAPRILADFAIGPVAMGWGFSAALVGLMIGAATVSAWADAAGRRRALIGSCLLMGVFSLATGVSPSFPTFLASRFLAGLGLGGAMPTINALVPEHATDRWRARAMTAMFAGVPTGAILGGVLVAAAGPGLGWRVVFLVGGGLTLALAPALLLLPRDRRSSRRSAPPLGVGALLAPERRRTTLSIWTLFFCNLLLVYTVVNWLPFLLTGAGLTRERAAMGPLAFNLGGIAGGAAMAPSADRYGSARIAPVAFTLAAAALVAFATSDAPGLGHAAAIGAGVGGAQFIINVVAAERYPAELRARGIGAAMTVGRIGAIAGPVALGGAMSAGIGVTAQLGSLAAVALLGALSGWLVTKGERR